ncbi:IS5 family transposase [Streptomyces sp. NPDC097727]|uniref:IS5 family transposase n=1 Tax=Streptomyces sp. NPDC097727 TaxID=3366092 RepID=UPI0038032FE1
MGQAPRRDGRESVGLPGPHRKDAPGSGRKAAATRRSGLIRRRPALRQQVWINEPAPRRSPCLGEELLAPLKQRHCDNGVKWRSVPADFPPWDRVYAFFRRWRDQGLAKEFHDRLRGRVRIAEGRRAEPTAGIIDSQSVKAAASVPCASRGYDGGKKINSRKRHVITDCLGLLLMVRVTAADVTDRDAARALLPRLHKQFRKVSVVWADGGYTGCLVDWAKEKFLLALRIVKRSDDVKGFVVLPRRWVVERSLGWLMRSRLLARDYEARPDSSEAFIWWSASMLMSRRLARRAQQPETWQERPRWTVAA